jgi:tetratricopeptide (TPR) repeat protein
MGVLALAAVMLGLNRAVRSDGGGEQVVADGGAAAGAAGAGRVSVAVLPFAVRGAPEFAYLREGMVDLLATTLDGVGDLRGIDPNAVLGTIARDGPAVLDPESGRAVAAGLGAGRYILGSVVQLGSRLQINAALYDGGGLERARAQVVVDGDTELMRGVDDLARQLVATELTDPANQLAGLAAATTHSLPALRAYLDGEFLLRDARPEAAIERLREAVTLDSTFALAWYRLARAAGWRGADSLNLLASARAFNRADSLPPRARTIVRAYHELRTGDPREAERQLRAIVAAYPNDTEGWLLLGEALFHNNPAQGRPTAEAREPLQQVMRRDPRNREITVHLMDLAAQERQLGSLDTLFTMYFSPNSEGELLGVRHTYIALHAQLLGGDRAANAAVLALRDAGPDAVAIALARVPTQLGDLRAAERLAAMLADPEHPPPVRANGLLHLALLELARGRSRAAADAWRSAAVLDPGAVMLHRALASALPFSPVIRDSILALRRTLAGWDGRLHPLVPGLATPDQELVRQYLDGLLSLQLGDAGGAREARQRLLAPARGADRRLANALGASLLAQSAWRRGRAVEALTALDNAFLPFPFPERARSPLLEQHLDRFTRAEALLALGRYDEALRWYSSLHDGYNLWGVPYLGSTLDRRGEIFERLGRRDDARRQYERLVDLWRDADSTLQPRVRQVDARLAELRP